MNKLLSQKWIGADYQWFVLWGYIKTINLKFNINAIIYKSRIKTIILKSFFDFYHHRN